MLPTVNRVKQRVQEGKTVLGFVCRTLSPVIVEIIGQSGFDFVWIDMEHTGADFMSVEALCRSADATGIESLVRVPDKNPSNVLRALEVGAGIVNVPQISDRAEVEALVRAAKYAPGGERGYCASSRGARYGFLGDARTTFASANERTMTMVQIESSRGVTNAPDICAVSGLDAVFVGLADLSQSLGITGQLDHPSLLEAALKVVRTSRAAGKASAMIVETPEDASKWVAEGVQILACGVDVLTFGRTLRRITDEFKTFRT